MAELEQELAARAGPGRRATRPAREPQGAADGRGRRRSTGASVADAASGAGAAARRLRPARHSRIVRGAGRTSSRIAMRRLP